MSENWGRDSNATPSLNFRDEGTGAVAFHHDARLDTQRLEEAVKANVILGVILPVKTDHCFSCDHFQSDGFKTRESMRRSNLGGPEVLPRVEMRSLTPGPDEILIKVQAASVKPLDWKMRAGHVNLRR